jgi:predicted dienelactone hydrolase
MADLPLSKNSLSVSIVNCKVGGLLRNFPSKTFYQETPMRSVKKLLGAVSFGILSAVVTPSLGLGAERIAFSYPPFGEFSLSTNSLELFAKEGKITNEFNFYASRMTQQQLAQFRDLLSRRFEVSPTMVSQFTYSPLGETVLHRMGEVLRTDSRVNGFYALRSAFILAATDPEGLTLLNVLRRFPTRSLRLDLITSQKMVEELSELLKKRDTIVAAIEQVSAQEALAQPQVDFSGQPDLRSPGSFKWHKQTLTLVDTTRSDRILPVDLYLPQVQGASPVVAISHGVAENRTTFAYLARHLASYGFAVAVIEHPGDNAQRFERFFAGLGKPPTPIEFINRPSDVKYLLDELERRSQSDPNLKGKLNLQQVGVIGHSLGGYTVLTLAGATINFEQLRQFCVNNNSLNMSILVQCEAAKLPPATYPVQDERVKAVIAVNPVSSMLLGKSGLSQIQHPLMMVAGSEDIVTPAVPEQIRPFTWLTTPEKYLALIKNGTHFSVLDSSDTEGNVLPVLPSMIGENPEVARSYLNALSVAFLQTHLANRPEYRSYLSASYGKFISQGSLNLSLVQSFSETQLTQAVEQMTSRPTVSTIELYAAPDERKQ